MSPHTQLAAAVLGAVLTAAAAAYYAWWRGRELHREMDAVLDHLARFENNLIGEPGDPEGGELGRQARNLERLRLIVESEPPAQLPSRPAPGLEPGADTPTTLAPARGACLAATAGPSGERLSCDLTDGHDGPHQADTGGITPTCWHGPTPEPPPTARMPVVAALIPTTAAPPTGPADIPPTDGNGDPPQQPTARAYSLTGPRPRPPGAHRPPKERET